MNHVPGFILRYDQDWSTVQKDPRKISSGKKSVNFGAQSSRTRRPKLYFPESNLEFGSRELWLILNSSSFLSNSYRYAKDYLSSARGNSSLSIILHFPYGFFLRNSGLRPLWSGTTALEHCVLNRDSCFQAVGLPDELSHHHHPISCATDASDAMMHRHPGSIIKSQSITKQISLPNWTRRLDSLESINGAPTRGGGAGGN